MGYWYLFMHSKMEKNATVFASDVNIKEGLYTTRMLLNQEISPGYKVYEAVIKDVNNGNQNIGKELNEAIKKSDPKER